MKVPWDEWARINLIILMIDEPIIGDLIGCADVRSASIWSVANVPKTPVLLSLIPQQGGLWVRREVVVELFFGRQFAFGVHGCVPLAALRCLVCRAILEDREVWFAWMNFVSLGWSGYFLWWDIFQIWNESRFHGTENCQFKPVKELPSFYMKGAPLQEDMALYLFPRRTYHLRTPYIFMIRSKKTLFEVSKTKLTTPRHDTAILWGEVHR